MSPAKETEAQREDRALRMSEQIGTASPGHCPQLGDPSGPLPPLHSLPSSSALDFTILALQASLLDGSSQEGRGSAWFSMAPARGTGVAHGA